MSAKGLERLEGPSRIGTAIAILLCVTLIYNTVLYGGVDTGVLTLASITTSLLLMLWGIHSWRTGEFCVYYTNLYFPIGALLALGLIQLLPLRNVDQLSEVVGIPASATLSLDPYATRFFVIRVVIYLIFFAAAVTFINSEKRVRRMRKKFARDSICEVLPATFVSINAAISAAAFACPLFKRSMGIFEIESL